MMEATLEKKKLRRREQWSKRGTKQHKETAIQWLQEPALSVALLSEMGVSCSERKGSEDWEAGRRSVCSEVEPAHEREKLYSLSV